MTDRLSFCFAQVDDQEHPMNFAQTFHLMKDPSGSFFVSHDIFKLVY